MTPTDLFIYLFALCITIVYSAIIQYALKHRTIPGANSLTLVLLAGMSYGVFYLLQLTSRDLNTALFWYNLSLPGANMLGPAWLVFAIFWTRQEKAAPKLKWTAFFSALFIIPVIVCAAAWSNPLHHGYAAGLHFETQSGVGWLHWDFGLFYWIGFFYAYALSAVGLAIVLFAAFKRLRLFFQQSVLLISGGLIPVVFNLGFVSGFFPTASIDLTPFTFLATGLVWSVAIFRFRFLSVMPIAHQNVFRFMPVGMIVLDIQGSVVDINPAAAEMMEISTSYRFRQKLPAALIEQLPCSLNPAVVEDCKAVVRLDLGQTPRTLEVHVRPLYDRAEKTRIGVLILLNDISELVRKEQILQESEARLVLAQKIAGVGNWELDLASGSLWASDEALRLYGMATTSAILPLKTAQELVVAADRPRLNAALQALLAGRGGYDEEFSICRAQDGALRVIHSVANLVLNAEGKPSKVAGVIQDVTERKQTEKTLQDNEARIAAVLRLSPAVIGVSTAAEGRYTDVNDAFEHVMGYNRAETIGHTSSELNLWVDADTRPHILREMKAKGQVENLEIRLRRKSGEIFPALVFMTPIELQNVACIITMMMDITDRKRTETALLESEARYRLIAENTGDVIWILDPETLRYRYVSPSVYQQRGYTPEEMMDQGLEEALLPESLVHFKNVMQARLENFLQGTHETALEIFAQPHKNGSVVWTETAIHYVKDETIDKVVVLGVSRDITARRQAEEQLRQTNAQLTAMVYGLEQRNREANLVHEMDDLLQACNLSEEVYTLVQQFGPQLFPATAGGLFLIGEARKTAEAAATWGEHLQSEHFFDTDECWVLRRGRAQYWSSQTPNFRCGHIPAAFSGDYVGIPMLAAGKLLGMLHIESIDHRLSDKACSQLAQTIAEHLALTLTNIKLREKLHFQSIRDGLTGLFNRRFMEEFLERELKRAQRKQAGLGLIILDIDHFKDYNDSYGHECGDEVLREMGPLLQNKTREGEIACRFGGEEFILILPETPLEITLQRAEQVRQAVSDLTVGYQQKALRPISVSVGVAAFPVHGSTAAALLAMADAALYQAKHHGRNRVEVAG